MTLSLAFQSRLRAAETVVDLHDMLLSTVETHSQISRIDLREQKLLRSRD